MTHLVYPGALHTRFHHALGAMHLTNRALDVLRSKGHEITKDESVGVAIAILLHDIGHGPFSHSLEHTIVDGINHEEISSLFMELLNKEFNGELSMAIEIFNNKYHKPFLHQLVSGQLDMDRLDYLKRDSFYTGVNEGEVGSDRIIDMLNVHNGHLAIDEKAIYSIENFIVARRFMYWQVYLHKTVVAAEHMLIQILERAKALSASGRELFCSPDLRLFLYKTYTGDSIRASIDALDAFSRLDDYDILGAIKVWCHDEDIVLANLCKMLINRQLFKVKMFKSPVSEKLLQETQESIALQYRFSSEQAKHFVVTGKLMNNAYDPITDNIQLLYKNGKTVELADASDNLNISALSEPVEKFFMCYART